MSKRTIHHDDLAAELDIPLEHVIILAGQWDEDGYGDYDEHDGLMTRACADGIRAHVRETARQTAR